MDGQEAPAESHDFNIGEVLVNENLTSEQACARCHEGKDIFWLKRGINKIKQDGYHSAEK